ncbi:MAG: HAMP domain-containing sensor histidine kinase [Halobacteria archaeon]|nr:HAMP domain-containing sensor histidine kinase [Halobacteria archaeon]
MKSINWRSTPVKVALAYSVFGVAWIFITDTAAMSLIPDPGARSTIQTVKGSLFVILSTVIVYILVRRTTSSLEESKRRLEKSQRELQKYTDKVNQQRREINVLNRVLRHNLRNDMNVILGYSQMVESESNQEYVEKIRKTADEILSICKKAGILENVVNRDRDDMSSVDIVDVIEAVVDEVEARYPEAKIETDLPDSMTAYTFNEIEFAVLDLVENSILHNDSDEPCVRISVESIESDDDDDDVVVCVEDNGPGIPDDEKEVLSENEETPLKHGSGIGLWIVSLLVEKSGGSLEFPDSDSSDGGDGGEVVLRLPKELETSSGETGVHQPSESGIENQI